jgi:hypothetical protein
MSYSQSLTLTLPADLLPIARMISRALDPDTGGADSWHATGTEDAATISMTTLCTENFYESAQAMMLDSSLLYDACVSDYAARWPDMTGPTAAECERFVSGIIPEPMPVVIEGQP